MPTLPTTPHDVIAPEIDHLPVDLGRVQRYLQAGDGTLPEPAAWLWPGAAASKILWPLVARRNLKRLLRTLVAGSALESARARRLEYQEICQALMDLPDDALDQLLARPEITSWLAGMAGNAEWDGSRYLESLAVAITGACLSAGVDCGELRVHAADDSAKATAVTWCQLGNRLWAQPGAGPVSAAVQSGVLHVTQGRETWELPHAVVSVPGDSSQQVGWQLLPRVLGSAVVSGGPDPWLDEVFPEPENVDDDPQRISRLAARIDEGLRVIGQVWPEMTEEISRLLHWIVPLRSGGSYFVPGFRSLVAVPDAPPIWLGLNVVHEFSHNKMSSVYELTDVLKNPDLLVFSPFNREDGPLASLVHSCIAFSRELIAIRRLEATGVLGDETDWVRLQRKVRVFFDKALPVLAQQADFTPYGAAIIAQVEAEVYVA